MALAQPSRKSGPLVFVIVLVVFVIGAFNVVQEPTTNRNVIQDLDGIIIALDSFGRGDTEGFVAGLLDAISILGLFIVLFVILYYLFTNVLGNVFNKRLGAVLSIIIIVYTVANQQMYNRIVSLNVFVIGFLVFSALLIMLWGFGEKQTKSLREEFKAGDPTKNERDAYKKRVGELKNAIAEYKRSRKD